MQLFSVRALCVLLKQPDLLFRTSSATLSPTDTMRIPESFSHQQFVRALQHEAASCATPGCPGPVESEELSQGTDRVKTYAFHCTKCGWQERIAGSGQSQSSWPTWDEATLLDMAYEHLMHQPAFCQIDGTPVVFTSMPNPRRKARYRLSCFYCGRQAEMDWPPPEARR